MNRDQLLAIRSGRVERVQIAGLGEMSLRVLNAREALELYEKFKQKPATPDLAAIQLAAYIGDESGARMFSDEEAAQLLEGLSASQVREIIMRGSRLNALDDEAVEDAGGN